MGSAKREAVRRYRQWWREMRLHLPPKGRRAFVFQAHGRRAPEDQMAERFEQLGWEPVMSKGQMVWRVKL